MSRIERLIQEAITNPKNLRFREFCTLCIHFGMKERNRKGSHVIFKRQEEPKFTLSIQDDNGMAKPYQVRQFISKLKEFNLYNFKEEE